MSTKKIAMQARKELDKIAAELDAGGQKDLATMVDEASADLVKMIDGDNAPTGDDKPTRSASTNKIAMEDINEILDIANQLHRQGDTKSAKELVHLAEMACADEEEAESESESSSESPSEAAGASSEPMASSESISSHQDSEDSPVEFSPPSSEARGASSEAPSATSPSAGEVMASIKKLRKKIGYLAADSEGKSSSSSEAASSEGKTASAKLQLRIKRLNAEIGKSEGSSRRTASDDTDKGKRRTLRTIESKLREHGDVRLARQLRSLFSE